MTLPSRVNGGAGSALYENLGILLHHSRHEVAGELLQPLLYVIGDIPVKPKRDALDDWRVSALACDLKVIPARTE